MFHFIWIASYVLSPYCRLGHLCNSNNFETINIKIPFCVELLPLKYSVRNVLYA